jgi:hypothetical protein
MLVRIDNRSQSDDDVVKKCRAREANHGMDLSREQALSISGPGSRAIAEDFFRSSLVRDPPGGELGPRFKASSAHFVVLSAWQVVHGFGTSANRRHRRDESERGSAR